MALSLCVCLQRDHLKTAQQFFQLVGGSASECGIFRDLFGKGQALMSFSDSLFVFSIRHYSWQTVHGLLLLPPETV